MTARPSRVAKTSAISTLFNHPAHSPINSDEERVSSDEDEHSTSSSEDENEVQNPGDWHYVDPGSDVRQHDLPDFFGTPGELL